MASKPFAGTPKTADGRLYGNVDELKRMQDLAAKYRVGVVYVIGASQCVRQQPHQSTGGSDL
jgi:hypothetical protein